MRRRAEDALRELIIATNHAVDSPNQREELFLAKPFAHLGRHDLYAFCLQA